MANVNVQISSAALQAVDNAASLLRVNSPLATVIAQVNACFYDPFILIPNPGPLVLTLPAATCWFVWILNKSGANSISITGTPAGGAAWASPYVLVPNGLFVTAATFASNPSSGGFSAISVASSAGGTYAEILLAA